MDWLPAVKRTLSYPYVENRSRKHADGTLYGRHFGRIRNETPTKKGKAINGVPVPESPKELAEIISDPANWAKVTETPELREEFLTEYNRLVNAGDSIARQVEEQVSAVLVETLKEWGVADNKVDFSELTNEIKKIQPGQHSATYNPRALGATIDDMFENSGEFFTAIWHNTDATPANNEKLQRLRNAFSEKVPSEGGFLVPETLRAELLKVALETAIVRSRARVIPMESLRVPFPAVDDTSHASSVFGGIVAYWTEEGADLTATNPKFGRIVLEAKKLTAYTEVPNELVADSVSSFQAYLDDLFPEALAFYEDVGFFQGSGAGEPQGFLNAAAAVSVTKETGQAADTIVWENIVKMYSRMLPGSLGRAVWLANNDTFPELATMALSVGTGGSAIWLNNGVTGPPMTILGRPVIFTEKAETIGDAGDINFVDFGYYLIGDRQVMTASSSPHYKFQADKTAYRIIERVDGRPWLQSAVTPQKSTTTLSPFVKIAART
jgi:HK97 family phage major capsid protein